MAHSHPPQPSGPDAQELSSSRKKIFSVLMVLFVLIFCAFSAEILLRLKAGQPLLPPPRPAGWAMIPEASWVVYDAQAGWIPKPNASGLLKKNGTEIAVHTNSLGMRGAQEFSKTKAPGICRLYALGDSFTFGFGVDDKAAFPAQIQRINPQWEVMNLGVPGYGVDQIYILMKKVGFEFSPNIVLISLYPEDFWRATRAFNDAGNGKPYFSLRPDGTPMLHHVPVPEGKDFSVPQFPAILEENALKKILNRSELYRLLQKAGVLLRKKLGWEDPDTTPEWLLGRAILKKMTDDIKASGIQPIIMIVPPKRWITGTIEPVRESLLRFGKRESVPVLDLTPVFLRLSRERTPEVYYIPQDDHWTETGNRVVAEIVLKFLEEENLSCR